MIQDKTQPFTLDAFANVNGNNAVCSVYCTIERPFVQINCVGHHTWINPPFEIKLVREVLSHYLRCKKTSPHNTSMCIILPAYAQFNLSGYLKGMTLIYVFPRFTQVFTVPKGDGTRIFLSPGLPFDLHVYYDPPTRSIPQPQDMQVDEQTSKRQKTVPEDLIFRMIVYLPHRHHGFKQTVPIVCGFDTLASKNFIHPKVLTAQGFQIKPHSSENNNTILLGDSSVAATQGVVNIPIQLGNFRDMVQCLVMELPPTFEIILGQPWLKQHNAILNYVDETCTIRRNGHLHKLQCSPNMPNLFGSSKELDYASSICSTLQHSTSTQDLILSPLQTKRLLRKPSKVNPKLCFWLLVTQQQSNLSISDNDDTDLQQVLQQHYTVFQEQPDGLPYHGDHDVEHPIQLTQGASPPMKPIFRLSKPEKIELEKTIKELLDKKFIEPSSSPFGAPILFVGKKDGSLRMCVDYRALNKLTIKNRYPLPRIDDLLDLMKGARYFSTLDLASGYHQIRIAKDDVQKTAFRTVMGHFQWRVMPFGLCNAPATFQQAMNSLFQDKLGQYLCVYMDDILVFSKSREEHLEHLHNVLQTLADSHYYLKSKKCCFMRTSVKFLGHVISAQGLQVDPDKINILKQWPVPKDKSEIRSLLGFGNYFRRFILRYSDMVRPLVELTKKDVPVQWSQECEQAFHNLKNAIINAPVLKHPDMNKPFQLVCDASNFASGAILIQDEHPCAFASKKFISAERNYTTEERELLAVIHALKLFRCYLEGQHFTICTDHHPLKYFDTKGDLTPRQARWAHYLSRFDYEWKWIKGVTNPADFLSRAQHLMVLTRQQTRSQAQEETQDDQSSEEQKKKKKTSTKKSKRKKRYNQALELLQQPTQSSNVETETSQHEMLVEDEDQRLDLNLIKLGYSKPSWQKWIAKTGNTANLTSSKGLWWHGKRIVLPDYQGIRQWVLREFHDSKYAGHLGVTKTIENIRRCYWWPSMNQHIKEYIQTCLSCQRNKADAKHPAGTLQPLPIPQRPWSSISMDLITDLPVTPDGKDAILVIVDRLTKMVHIVPCTKTSTSLELALLFHQNIFKLHGLPTEIISDRDPRFTSNFWKELCRLLGVKQNLTSPYHPQSDGQTERMNRILEEMLRHYVSPYQTEWIDHLTTCEFAINNAVQESTKYSPFYLTYGYHPLTPAMLLNPSSVPSAEELHKQINADLAQAKVHLEAARKRQKYYYDTKRRLVYYELGQQVLLSTANIGLYCAGSPKLLPRYIGPFKVTKRIGELAYKLDLPTTMKIHDVFHVSRLKPYRHDNRVQPPPLPITINGELEYEVEMVYGHRDLKKGSRKIREYLVRWKGYDVEHDEYIPEVNFGNKVEPINEYWKTVLSSN